MLSAKTLPKAKSQEVFDHVANHLLTQKQKSLSQGSTFCRYRTLKLRCAAGCLFTDDEYDKDFEGCSWLELADNGSVPKKHAALIQQLQNIHDDIPVSSWKTKLNELAKKRKLKEIA